MQSITAFSTSPKSYSTAACVVTSYLSNVQYFLSTRTQVMMTFTLMLQVSLPVLDLDSHLAVTPSSCRTNRNFTQRRDQSWERERERETNARQKVVPWFILLESFAYDIGCLFFACRSFLWWLPKVAVRVATALRSVMTMGVMIGVVAVAMSVPW